MKFVRTDIIHGKTVISEELLEGFQDGIVEGIETAEIAVASRPKSITIDLPASNWIASETNSTLYSQTVTVTGVTANSKIDLTPSPEQLSELLSEEISLVAANDDGAVTVFAIGDAPANDYVMQAMLTEVVVE